MESVNYQAEKKRGDDEFRTLITPQVIQGQRVSGLHFGGTTALAGLTVRRGGLMFRHLSEGFTNSALRQLIDAGHRAACSTSPASRE